MSKFLDKVKNKLKLPRYYIEVAIVKIGMLLFCFLGVDKSSNLGSFLGRRIGKLISVQKLARNNLRLSMPYLDEKQIGDILDGMWDNLGRIVGEFVHISRMSGKNLMRHIRINNDSQKNIEFLKKNKKGGIIFSGHIGNWEIGSKILLENGLNVKILYRPLNNSFVDNITASIRGIEHISKGPKGNKQIIQELKNGNYVVILIDQRVGDGILVPFFGKEALTTASVARLALKYNVPLIPARSIRVNKKFAFEVRIEKPLEFKKTGNITNGKVFTLTAKMNKKLEEWIKEYPSQWFWVHNRWKK